MNKTTFFKSILTVVAFMTLSFSAYGQSTIAAWTFPTTSGSAASIIAAECGQLQANSVLYADGTNGSDNWSDQTSRQFYAGNSPTAELCSTTTATGALSLVNSPNSYNGKSIVFKLSTLGFQNLKLDYDTRGSSTGFATQEWLYSTNGTSFTSQSTITGRNVSSFSAQSVDFSTISALNNLAVVYIKLTFSGATGTGNNRIDNVKFSANAATSCTASNLSFASATVNKLVTDVPFTITATSLNATTAITYGSDNLAVATVNETTGEVTLVGAGSAKITATQVAGTHSSVDYCAASTYYDLTVNSAAPTITVTEVTIPVFETTVGDTDSETMQVSAVNLTSDVILSITGTDAGMFSVTPATITPASGTVANVGILINYTPTAAGSHSATLNIASTGAETVTRSLSGSATWAPLTKPVLTGATDVSSTTLTLNWDAVSGATEYEVNVYTKSGGASSTLLSENFVGFVRGTANASPSSTDVSASLDTYTQTTGWTGVRVYEAGGTVKIGGGSTLGYIVTPSINLSANAGVFNLAFEAMAWSGDATELYIYLDDVLVHTVTGLNNTDYTLAPFSVDLTGGTSTSKIKFEGKQATKGRFFLENIVVSLFGSSISPVVGSPFTVSTNSKALTDLTTATTYYYTVKAKNDNVSSDVSDEQSVATLGTSVYSPSGKLEIRIINGQAVFEAQANQSFEVYNAIGQKLMSTRTSEGLNKLSIQAKGVVVIKIDNEIVKVVL